jgi:hypothetical protein
MTLFSIDKNMHTRYIVAIHGKAPAGGDLLLCDGEEIGGESRDGIEKATDRHRIF